MGGLFSSFGIPKILIADNNPFNSFECREFSTECDFEIITSSPLYAKSKKIFWKKQKIKLKFMLVWKYSIKRY